MMFEDLIIVNTVCMLIFDFLCIHRKEIYIYLSNIFRQQKS